ncbi:MAG TPA: hypothetical protein VET26_00785 [Candidatus Sulfotelmatobacter sp.]|nr:hypothetical protein [Candidatus Sulfotelmatobacter sp.]
MILSGGDIIRRWRDDPRAFVRECLGAEPDDWQDDALVEFNRKQRIALCASKGPGKSTLLAWLIWLFLLTRPHPKVMATSCTGVNLRDGLWTELNKWQQRAELLKKHFTWTASRVFANGFEADWFASARTWSRQASIEEQADTLAGFHGEHVMALCDEAGSTPRGVIAAGEAVLANGGDSHLVIAGNTTDIDSALGEVVTKERNLWAVFEVNGDPDNPKRSKRVPVGWARELIEKHGRDDPYVLVNVFGKFPPRSTTKLLGPADVDAAVARTLSKREWASEPKVLGVDVARDGEAETVLQMRQGRAVFPCVAYRGLDTMQIVGYISTYHAAEQFDAICVDACGVGAGVADRGAQLGLPCYAIDSSQKAIRQGPLYPRFYNRRAEMWWVMADFLKKGGGCLPNDGLLRAQLQAPNISFDRNNALKLETKEEMKRRGVDSPDRGDALAYTFGLPLVVARAEAQRRTTTVHEYNPHDDSPQLPGLPSGYSPIGHSVDEYDPHAGRL